MEFSNYTMQSVYFCNLKRELGCILACVDEIGEETCHAELVSASDQRRMDKFSVSRHCERSEAIQENGDLFRLLCRFTPRNDIQSFSL